MKAKNLYFLLGGVLLSSMALTEAQAAESDNITHVIDAQADQETKPLHNPLENAAPKEQIPDLSEQADSQTPPDREQVFAYLKANPKEMESIILYLIRATDAARLDEILPYYLEYPQHDPAIIDWGNAIIAGSSNNLKESIRLFRKINSMLPDSQLLRLQMAIALFLDKQYAAAKNEFIKLRSEDLNEQDLKNINAYIDRINEQSEWSFQAGASYLHDDNITNSPDVGTKQGNWTYTTPHESGTGLNYSLGVAKKQQLKSNYYANFGIDHYGSLYFDNKKYNDLSTSLNFGIGYQNANSELEFGPVASVRHFSGGSSSKLSVYSKSYGVQFSQSYWLNQQLRYSNFNKISRTEYSKYTYNNYFNYMIDNSLMYFAGQNTFFFGGINLQFRRSESESTAYNQFGGRVGWGQTWPLGMSSRASVFYARSIYRDVDFFRVKKNNYNYGTSLSLWNRALHFKGVTPKFVWNYSRQTSNSAFDEFHKHNISIELSKTF